jgi:hypothetical protein
MSLDSIRNRGMESFLTARSLHETQSSQFKEVKLPVNSRLITPNDKIFDTYLKNRGLSITDYPFRITPNDIGRNKNRIIIPYTYKNKAVGWTSRFLDTRKPKYLNEHQQAGYLFGLDFQKPNWQYAIVAEGVLDAISINCLAVMHNEFTEQQLAILHRLGKEIIVVPDQDKAGMVLFNESMEQGFSISVPNWGKNNKNKWITDINDAIQQYGKITTLLSIIHAKEPSKILNLMALNNMKKRLNIR